jgi:hypothetical protein
MKTFEFTILLADIADMTPELANQLFEAGCSDGSPLSSDGVAAVGFDRKARSLEAAIPSAIADVEKAGLAVPSVQLGGEEIAALR